MPADTRGEVDALLSQHLAVRGLKSTRQRSLIVEAFLAAKGHVSVEELLLQVRAADPRVSTATVYRTMKLLTEAGLASAQDFGGGQTRYEPVSGKAHHDHLVCSQCGAIEEFEDPRIEELQRAIARQHGFALSHHRMELYGTCRRCQHAASRASQKRI